MEKKRSEFLSHEDWWSIWIGFAIILAGFAYFLMNPPDGMQQDFDKYNAVLKEESKKPFKTIEWYQASELKGKIKGTNTESAKFLKQLTGKPKKWTMNPLESILKFPAKIGMNYENIDSLKQLAGEYQTLAGAANFQDSILNNRAQAAIYKWLAAKLEVDSQHKKLKEIKSSYNAIPYLMGLALFLGIIFAIGAQFMQGNGLKFFFGFFGVFALAVISYIIAAQTDLKAAGLGYALWAILLGLIISNTVGTPKWMIPAIQTEFFIKTGLVLLGAEVLFGKIIQIGIPGLMVAWIVTPVVIIVAFWFGKKYIKVKSDELNITLCAATSVCGVSAAIATASACKAKKEELTLAVGLSLIFTAIMMVLMPAFIEFVAMPEILGGAWMGGVIDSTGAVAAAGAFLGEKALYVSATIKMIQNILIGVVAFTVAIWWTMRKGAGGQRPNAMEIWYRFPKFVIGFVFASIFASAISAYIGTDQSYALIDNGVISGFTKNLRGWMFCLAFVSIGLSTNFRELKSHFKGGKPFWLYIFGQTFNLLLTLLIAWIAFYLIFPHITEAI